MAIIIDITNSKIHVVESKDRIDQLMKHSERIKIGFIPVTIKCSVSGMEKGKEYTRQIEIKASFSRSNIIYYHD